MVFDSVTNKLTNSGGAQQDELIEANAEEIVALQADVGDLQAALDGGPVETSGPTVHLSTEDVDDIGAEVLDNRDAHLKLERGNYPIKTPIDLHGNADWSELRIDAPLGTRLVVASGDLDYVLRCVGTQPRHQTFDQFSLRNLALVVDPDQGYDAGWGRWLHSIAYWQNQ